MKGDKQKHEVNTFSLALQVELARLGELIERVDQRVDTHKAVLVEMPELSKRLDSNQLASNRIEHGLLEVAKLGESIRLADERSHAIDERVAQIDIERVDERCDVLFENAKQLQERADAIVQELSGLWQSVSALEHVRSDRLEAFESRLNLIDSYIETALEMRPVVSSDAPVVIGGAMLIPGVHRTVAPVEAKSNHRWVKAGLFIGAAVGSAVGSCSVLLWWLS